MSKLTGVEVGERAYRLLRQTGRILSSEEIMALVGAGLHNRRASAVLRPWLRSGQVLIGRGVGGRPVYYVPARNGRPVRGKVAKLVGKPWPAAYAKGAANG